MPLEEDDMNRLSDQIMNQQVEHKCPKCGRTIRFTLRQIDRRHSITCSSCHSTIALQNTGDRLGQLERGAQALHRKLDKLSRQSLDIEL